MAVGGVEPPTLLSHHRQIPGVRRRDEPGIGSLAIVLAVPAEFRERLAKLSYDLNIFLPQLFRHSNHERRRAILSETPVGIRRAPLELLVDRLNRHRPTTLHQREDAGPDPFDLLPLHLQLIYPAEAAGVEHIARAVKWKHAEASLPPRANL